MQMNGHLSEYDEKAITDVFLHEKNAGIIGGYCEDGFPLYYANDKMAKMLGYPDTASLAEGIGGMVANTIHPDDMPQVQKTLPTAITRVRHMRPPTVCSAKTEAGSGLWIMARSSGPMTAGSPL